MNHAKRTLRISLPIKC